jgi:hypothetical protein
MSVLSSGAYAQVGAVLGVSVPLGQVLDLLAPVMTVFGSVVLILGTALQAKAELKAYEDLSVESGLGDLPRLFTSIYKSGLRGLLTLPKNTKEFFKQARRIWGWYETQNKDDIQSGRDGSEERKEKRRRIAEALVRARNWAIVMYGAIAVLLGSILDLANTSSHVSKETTAPRPTVTQPPTAVAVGKTVLLAPRTRTSNCKPGPTPDRRCSPGAYYTGLTKAVLCSATFRTGTVRDVPDSEKNAVEIEYGMTPKSYGRTIEIDHIVSLELGGSNDPANLFPEPGSGAANYHVKDKLENKLHDLVCAGAMTFRAAQHQIAANWEALYKRVFGVTP